MAIESTDTQRMGHLLMSANFTPDDKRIAYSSVGLMTASRSVRQIRSLCA